jgi:hypothetical protein
MTLLAAPIKGVSFYMGGNVLKLLALGADAVITGHPFSVAALGGL